MRKILLPLMGVLTIWGFAQSPTSHEFQILAIKVADGDKSAILRAGESGDRSFIPVLREAIKRYSKSDKPVNADTDYDRQGLSSETVSSAARLALARLGDISEQQAIFCEMYSKNTDIHAYAMGVKLPYIGGWYRINALMEFLQDRPENAMGWAKFDTGYPNLMRSAVLELRRLFPDGPAPKGPENLLFGGLLAYREDALKWQQWIESHKKKLMQMKPAGSYSYENCPVESFLHGTVSDDLGKPIANARLQVEWDTANAKPNEYSGLRFILISHEEGAVVEALPPGPYRVCVTEESYLQECRNIRLEGGRDSFLHVSLIRDTEYSRDALQFLLNAKRTGMQAGPRWVERAFATLSHDISYAEALVGLLDFESGESETRTSRYQAIGALTTMGKPAIPYLIEAIKQNGTEVVRTNAAHALGLIIRTCQREVIASLESEAAKPETGSEQQIRLRAAMNYIAGLNLPCESRTADPDNF
jgi:hypothetical protein